MQWLIIGYDVNGNIEAVRTGIGSAGLTQSMEELCANARVDHMRCESESSS